MNYLFDASSLLQIIKNLDEQNALRLLTDNYVLDLTKYEVGNAIWKQHRLRHAIDEKEFYELLDLFSEILPKVKVVAVEDGELRNVAEIAAKEKTTFYDSSYIVSAKRRDLTLVTEDGNLAKLAAKRVKVTSGKQLI
jgi:predicted nucleic acid-binding protein